MTINDIEFRLVGNASSSRSPLILQLRKQWDYQAEFNRWSEWETVQVTDFSQKDYDNAAREI